MAGNAEFRAPEHSSRLIVHLKTLDVIDFGSSLQRPGYVARVIYASF